MRLLPIPIMPFGETLMPPYNIGSMKALLHEAQMEALQNIRGQFTEFLQEISGGVMTTENLSRNRLVDSRNLNSHEDISSVYSSPGLYIICTSFSMPDNDCTFSLEGGLQAIYRGECATVMRRLESHLFNEQYRNGYENRKAAKLDFGDKFSEPYYGACVKIDPNVSGINIDQGEYANHSWAVVVLKMFGSSSALRKEAELAFDGLFGKPPASRE